MHALTSASALPLFAHSLGATSWSHWDTSLLIVLPMLVFGLLYAVGLGRVWTRAGIGRGIGVWPALSFAAGWLVTFAALVSPVAWLSAILLSVHMTQHMLLLLIAAPLLTFGQPLLACMWAFDGRGRERLAAPLRTHGWSRVWRALTAPLAVFLLQAAVLWLWHIPSWYEAALEHDAVHALEHLCLLIAGSLFWWALVHGRYGRKGYGLAVVYVFLTAIHSSALGGLLTLSPRLWYGHYDDTAAAWDVDALADQQLAGLLMWVPAGIVFIVFGLALLAAWLGEAERRARLGVTDAAARRVGFVLLLAVSSALSTACGTAATREAQALTGGSAERGMAAVGRYGCGTCHAVPAVRGAGGTVGPPLTRVAARHYLGGHLVNTPDNMIKWIQHPQAIDPRNAMPELGVTDQDARDIAAFLYTLR